MSDYTAEYGSVLEMMDAARPYVDHYRFPESILTPGFAGVASWAEVETLAVNGWESETDKALAVARDAVDSVWRDHSQPKFESVWGVTGSSVDVGRYLSGEPENMVEFVPNSSTTGRVVVMCVSVCSSGAVSTESITRRGHAIVATAVALAEMGFTLELWADISVDNRNKLPRRPKQEMRLRCLVKGANEHFDAARIMFAFAHPAMHRVLGIGARCDAPNSVTAGFNRNGITASGGPIDPKQDLPDGTIYTPCLSSNTDVPDADVALLGYLRDLGIVDRA